MSAGILEFDKGIVNVESTWHGLPQYKCVPDRAPTMAEAMEIASYRLKKARLGYLGEDGGFNDVEAWAVVREDHNIAVVPSVGTRFDVIANTVMLNTINEGLLAVYPELKIESVGTLWNGATFFVSLKVAEFEVRGDRSPVATHLLYANPMGRGSYVACVHNTRIVCNNTERLAEAQGLANHSLRKFRHTAGAEQKISEYLIDLAEFKLVLGHHKQRLDGLAAIDVDTDDINRFLDQIMPKPENAGPAALTIAERQRTAFMDILEGTQAGTMDNPYTKYGLYCAYTDYVDHSAKGRMDAAAITYDGILGDRAQRKADVLQLLSA